MDQKQRGQLMKLARDAHRDGLQEAARMAREMSDEMLTGKIPNVSGPAALVLFASLLDYTTSKPK